MLDPAQFYILVSAESVHVPALYAAEMVPFDPLVGEFRVHYAGFFDPGFGHGPAGGHGSRAVLEVRSHEVPFILEHGQTIGRLVYERMAAPPAEPLRRGARLELSGAGPEALEAFSRTGVTLRCGPCEPHLGQLTDGVNPILRRANSLQTCSRVSRGTFVWR